MALALASAYFDSLKRRVGGCVAPRLSDAKRHHFRLGEIYWRGRLPHPRFGRDW